ncbi:hypothetical protein BH23CHL7_BH23CHL7_00920 [soil metagenome]
MDFERRLSEVVHQVANADPPADVVSRAVARLPVRAQPGASMASSPSPLALAAIVGALALVALVVVFVWRPGPLPPAQDPSPSATVRPTSTGTPGAGISSPLPSPSPLIDADDPEAWEVLVALERELGRIGQIRRLERSSGGGLKLEVTFLASGRDTAALERALSRLGLTADVAIEQGPDGGFVRLRLDMGAAVAMPTPALGCGDRLEMSYRIDVPDEARLVDAQHAAARALEGRVIRTLADRFEVHAAPHQDGQVLVVLTGNYGPVDEGPLHESLAGPVAVEFLLAPPDSNPQAPPTGADRLFGGSRVASARPTVDRSGRAAVEVVLTGEGASALDAALPDQMGHFLVITLDGTVLSAATINASRFGGELLLTGDFSVSDAVQIARALAAGADRIEVFPEQWQLTRVDC